MRNRSPSVCRKSFRLLIYECIKGSTIVGKADTRTIVITEGNRAQKSVCAEYGNGEVSMSSSFPPPKSESIPRLSICTYCDVLGRALCEIHNRI